MDWMDEMYMNGVCDAKMRKSWPEEASKLVV